MEKILEMLGYGKVEWKRLEETSTIADLVQERKTFQQQAKADHDERDSTGLKWTVANEWQEVS